MADVLLVHVREDETLADNIGISLERSGLTVARGESVFDVGDEVPCVVVLWSDVSTRSSMVRDVAIRAQREGKLVAVTLGGCETPLGFSRPAPHDLSEWGGDPDDPVLDPVFFAADRLVCAAKLGGPKPQRPTQPYAQRPAAPPQADIRAERQPRDVRFDSLPETPLPRARAYELSPVEEQPAPRAPAPSPAPAAERDMPPNLAAETLAWKQIEHSKNPQDFLDYLGHYGPKGLFSELASMKLDKLTQKSPAAAKGGFIAHKASPHVDKPKAKAAPPPAKREERPAPRPQPEARPVRAEARPVSRAEPAPSTRPDRPMSRLSEIERPSAADAPPRTRVSAAARRRAPQAARVPVHEESRRAAPWGALAVVVVLAGGGFAAFQNLPKAEQKAEAPPGFTEALRAAPADSAFTPAEDDDALEATSFADAASAPTPAAKREAAAKPVRVAEAPKPREGIGGPIVTIAPKDTGGGAKTPPPVVTFRPVEPTPAVSTPAPAPTPAPAVAPPVAAIDPMPAPAPARYVTARWVKQPGAQALARYFPQAALDSGLSGTAVLDCAILQSGKLNCVVQSETPRGHGFGAAAVSVSQSYLASPQAADGTMAYGNRTRLTLQFK